MHIKIPTYIKKNVQTEQNVYRVPTEWSLKLAIYVFRT